MGSRLPPHDEQVALRPRIQTHGISSQAGLLFRVPAPGTGGDRSPSVLPLRAGDSSLFGATPGKLDCQAYSIAAHSPLGEKALA